MAAADWSSDATFSSAVPTITAAPTVATPTKVAAIQPTVQVNTGAAIITSGVFLLEGYSDSGCSIVSHGFPFSGAIGACLGPENMKIKVLSCSDTKMQLTDGLQCNTQGSPKELTLTSTCTHIVTDTGASLYYKAACGATVAAIQPTVLTSGAFLLEGYSDSGCSIVTHGFPFSGALGACHGPENMKIKVLSCSDTKMTLTDGLQCNTQGSPKELTLTTTCTHIVTDTGASLYYKAACGVGVAASDASVKMILFNNSVITVTTIASMIMALMF